MSVVNVADIDKVMAWKNGYFNFEDATLEEVMKQLERWYDLEVVYKGPVPNMKFKGIIPRNTPLSTVLKGLHYVDLDYRIVGRRFIIGN